MAVGWTWRTTCSMRYSAGIFMISVCRLVPRRLGLLDLAFARALRENFVDDVLTCESDGEDDDDREDDDDKA